MAKAKTIERQQQQRPTAAPAEAQPYRPGFISRHFREVSLCAVLTVAIWLVFAQTGSHGFVNFDDWDYVGDNPAVLSGITWEGFKFAFTTKMAADWHPITWLSHMLDVQLFGDDPGAMHVVSVWLHVANAMLVFSLLRYLTGAFWRSAAVAALFAIHPLHVEPVAWLADRKDLVATFFWLLTALTYGYWAKRAASWRWFALAHVGAALAALSKPSTVTLPITLLLLDAWPLGRMDNPAQRVFEKAGFFLLAAVQSVVTYLFMRDFSAIQTLPDVTFVRKAANAIASYGTYLWQTVWPRNLTPMYPFPQNIEPLPVAAGAIAIILISWLAFRRVQKQPYFAAGWFWYLAVLAPTIGLVQGGLRAHADRYTYVALLGIFWVIVWGLHDWLGETRWQSGALQAAAAAVGVALMWQSYAQAALWANDRTLFGHTLAATGPNRLANTVVGLSLLREKKYDDADKHLRAALAIDPTFMPAYRHLAELRFAQQKPDEALKLLNQAATLEPRAAVTYYNRGIVLKSLGRKSEALSDFEMASKIGLDPDRYKRANLESGLIKNSEGKSAEALKFFEKALDTDPFYYLAQKNLAFTHYSMKNYDQALFHFQALTRLDPSDQDVSKALASIKKK